MAQLITGLTVEQIEALKAFYEQSTGRSATEILLDGPSIETKEKQRRYIYGIMKNRFFQKSVESQGLSLLLEADKAGVSMDALRNHAKACGSWTHFRETVMSLIDEKRSK